MGQHPLNLALRFILEMASLFSIGYWGWTGNEGILRVILAISLPLIAAVLWGVFRVPGDESSGAEPVVAVPGLLRLLLELALFSFASWGLYRSGAVTAAWVLGGVTLIHYLISYDRVWWLLKQ
jgi:hypothetical protein